MTIDHFSIFSSNRILDVRLLKENYSANNIKLNLKDDGKSVQIDFDYLDQNQGAIIQIIHTGLSSDELKMEGSIMGMKNIIRISPENLINSQPLDISRKTWFLSITLGLLGYYSIFIQKSYFVLFMSSDFMSMRFVGLIFLIMVLIAWAIPIIYIGNYIKPLINPNNTIPKGLEQFEK